MQGCFYYDGFKMDVTIIDSIIQEQTNIDYNERMRENNYEVVKVHLTDVISKIVDGSHCCTSKWHIVLIASCCYKDEIIDRNNNIWQQSPIILCICHGFISDKQAILESGQNIEEINFNIKNPIITTRKRRPVEREIEYINKYLKTHINFENERLLPIPQSPIANEAVVHEISRQLGNWNVETSQNGIVITSQGGYDFSLLTFLGQPFTPIFVAEVVNVSKEAIFNEYEKDDDDENITHQKCKWEDLDSDNILPDFTLDIEFVEKIILQKYEDDELLIEEVKENEDKGEKPMKKI
ncbi:hypothetical protein GLOIN_2v1878753 [Rhizophagus irregularis DAOM 181602=DAOM 197198]|uniref:Uncharacterized protein n=1 Tax=Rhizophagus irregularis (strain DAOM 181602 / DAOM 197198 / MUCL 43194) TaxID=747089 RepID=A0A2P4PR35_RHIID|nr:hypothetical protein GLOIN_2v1878753 [Rhizophagus irregularis DAOM 181602=DAOM 197198]POG67846.1 hypothetical protein GLOIN_2v1878753 [Rhizophagus irregularis DAOM 181602=DAOM 197198]|eukprot:XP_025174712.1 hypothetical protein GLOIN_2v1878753 [Rhizophagus irregularis DAOM 181602=DAOM 197198]